MDSGAVFEPRPAAPALLLSVNVTGLFPRSYGAYRLKNVRQLIQRKAAKQEQLEFMEEHPIIRNMDVYGDLVRNSLRQPPPSWQADDASQRPSGSD